MFALVMMDIMTITGGREGKFEDTLDPEKKSMADNFLLFVQTAHWMSFNAMMTN